MQCRGAGVAGASPGEFLQVPTSVWSWNAELLARSSTSVLSAAMPFELCVPDRRVRRKTWLGFEFVPDGSDPALPLPPPLPVAQDEHSLPEEVATSVKRVYLVTLPALQRQSGDSRSLVCPSTWKHQDVAAVLVDAFRRPAHTRNNAGWGRKATELECMVVFRERHAPRAGEAVGPFHWHIALKASSCFRFAPFKRSLAVNHGVASHWSSTHTGLWSAIRYGYILPQTSLRKFWILSHFSGMSPESPWTCLHCRKSL